MCTARNTWSNTPTILLAIPGFLLFLDYGQITDKMQESLTILSGDIVLCVPGLRVLEPYILVASAVVMA